MNAQVKERKASAEKGGSKKLDVFSLMVEANKLEGTKLGLDDSELVRTLGITLSLLPTAIPYPGWKRFRDAICGAWWATFFVLFFLN